MKKRKFTNYVIVHTAAFLGKNADVDMIDGWHKERGFSGFGYHYFISDGRHPRLKDGEVQKGRPENAEGAHVYGLNSSSIGICCAGHGDFDPLTTAQKESLAKLIAGIFKRYPHLIPESVLGHREINKLVNAGMLSDRYRTTKTCPGAFVDMFEVRYLVKKQVDSSN